MGERRAGGGFKQRGVIVSLLSAKKFFITNAAHYDKDKILWDIKKKTVTRKGRPSFGGRGGGGLLIIKGAFQKKKRSKGSRASKIGGKEGCQGEAVGRTPQSRSISSNAAICKRQLSRTDFLGPRVHGVRRNQPFLAMGVVERNPQ